MHARPVTRFSTRFAVTAILAPLLSCSSDPAAPGAALVATWNASSFLIMGQDLVAQGMTLSITFSPADTYTLTITGDLIGACSPDSDCVDDGTYTATDTQITLDAGTPDEETLTYAIQGATLTLTGTIDGTPLTVTLTRG